MGVTLRVYISVIILGLFWDNGELKWKLLFRVKC